MAARKKVARSARAGTGRSGSAPEVGGGARKVTRGKAGAAGRKATGKGARRATGRKAAGTSGSSRKGSAKAAPARKAAGRKGAAGKAAGRKTTARRARAGSEERAFPQLEALCELMERHGLLEVDYKVAPDGTQEYRVSRAGSRAAPGPVLPAAGPAPEADPGSDAPPPGEPAEELHAFKSPMVGTFYRAPSPEAPPFISVGDSVDSASVVCIIEAMKVMNEITPDLAGEVVSIEVENGEAVEYGQTLMLLRPR